jgi:uncharacterized protein YndB with AHSA1/START domain
MQPPDGELFHLAAEFLEVDPPSRLVYTFRWEEPDPDDQETAVKLSVYSVGHTTGVCLRQFIKRNAGSRHVGRADVRWDEFMIFGSSPEKAMTAT